MAGKKNYIPREYFGGIDFGASNIKAALLRDSKIIPVVLNRKNMGAREIPTVLYYHTMRNGGVERIIGDNALQYSMADRPNAVVDIKRNLRKKSWEQDIPALGKSVTAEMAAADIFACLRKAMDLDEKDRLRLAITVPVCFTSPQISVIRNAARTAGFEVETILTEPFASLFALNTLAEEQAGMYLIFDFGGSTLDVSIVRIDNDGDCLHVHELAAGGIQLGGLDLDEEIFTELVQKNHQVELEKIFPGESPEVRRQLILQEVEKNKKIMFADDEDQMYASLEPKIVVFRKEVVSILKGEKFADRIISLLDSLFDQLAENEDPVSKNDIDAIFPLGGVMRIPCLQELLQDYFGREIFDAENFSYDDIDDFINGVDDRYLAVAAGAARFLEMLDSGTRKISVINAIPFRIGYLKQGRFESCLPKNSPAGYWSTNKPLPLSQLEADGWRISICQSFADAGGRDAVFIGEIALDRKQYEAGETPLLRMRMGADGNLHVRVFQRNLVDEDDNTPNIVEEFSMPLGG